jgi:hypothetical protein
MNAMIAAVRGRCCPIGLAIAVVIGACTAPAQAPAAGDYATIEPETGSPAALPGMPPPPHIPQLRPQPPAPAPRMQFAGGATMPSDLEVVSWGIGPHLGSGTENQLRVGEPLYLWMTLAGGQAAVARLRDQGPIAIEVHWSRADSGGTAGAPDLVTRLTIGQSDLVPVYAGEVQRQGYFEWHSWARKDSLSPGTWQVSLTYADGQPLLCGQSAPRACQFSITIG